MKFEPARTGATSSSLVWFYLSLSYDSLRMLSLIFLNSWESLIEEDGRTCVIMSVSDTFFGTRLISIPFDLIGNPNSLFLPFGIPKIGSDP